MILLTNPFSWFDLFECIEFASCFAEQKFVSHVQLMWVMVSGGVLDWSAEISEYRKKNTTLKSEAVKEGAGLLMGFSGFLVFDVDTHMFVHWSSVRFGSSMHNRSHFTCNHFFLLVASSVSLVYAILFVLFAQIEETNLLSNLSLSCSSRIFWFVSFHCSDEWLLFIYDFISNWIIIHRWTF